jgi:hypothetical protein
VILLLGFHVGIWLLSGDAKSDCHAMQDGGIDGGRGDPCRNEALLDQDGQSREIDLGRSANWLWRHTNGCCLQHLEFLLDFR